MIKTKEQKASEFMNTADDNYLTEAKSAQPKDWLYIGYSKGYDDGYEAGQREAGPKWISLESMTEENCPWEFGQKILLKSPRDDLPTACIVCEGIDNEDETCGILLVDSFGDDLSPESFTDWMPLPEAPEAEHEL